MSSRPYILNEANWEAVSETDYDLVVLPWGATEAHNFHLPYGTDNIQNEKILETAAEKAWNEGAKVVILPNIPFGVNTGQDDIKLDINMNPSTQAAILNDVIDVLNRQQLYKLLVFNGHGGNDFKQMIREAGLKFPKMFISTCNWYQSVDWQDYFTDQGDHAGEMETSVMMHIAPDIIQPLEKAGDGHAKEFKIKALREKWAWAERKWSKVTKDTGIGDPANSTKEKGEAYFKVVTEKVAELMIDLSKADKDDMYS